LPQGEPKRNERPRSAAATQLAGSRFQNLTRSVCNLTRGSFSEAELTKSRRRPPRLLLLVQLT